MLFILATVFLSIFCLVWVCLRQIFNRKIMIGLRLQELKSLTTSRNGGIEDELQNSFKDRICKPILSKVSAFTQKYTPLKQRELTEKKLIYAGRPLGWSASDFISVQYATAVVLAIVVYILASIGHATSRVQYLEVVSGFMAGYFLWYSFIRIKTSQRQAEIQQGLPDMLDLLTISVEAGLGFDAALQRVIQKSQGPLSQEFAQSLQEMRMGKTRKETLRDLGLRNNVDELNNFVSAIIQADQLGVSISNVLRTQSEQMRVVRRQKVEEKAMKAPIKILMPMVLFIFPTIFLVLLGPTVLQMLETMK